MTTNITWTSRERDVVLQMAVFLYRHGRLRFNRPTHNEAWRNSMLVLPVHRRRNFTSASNLGRIYELYMGLLAGEPVDLSREIVGHKELEFPDYMILADRIDLDMIQRFGATLDTSVPVPVKKLSQQEQIDFLMKEVERLQKQVMDLTHAFEVHSHDRLIQASGGTVITEAGQRMSQSLETWRGPMTGRISSDEPHESAAPKTPKLSIVKGRTEGGEYQLVTGGTLHHPYPTHAPDAVEGNTALEDEAAVEGDGIGDDPGAEYNPDNYSDMDEKPEHVEAEPVEQPSHEANAKKFWSYESADPEHVHRRKLEAIGLDPAKFGVSTHDAENEKPAPKLAVVPEPTGPVLYFYGVRAQLRPLLGHVLSKCPIKIRTVHLDEGGKTPTGDAAVIVITNEWLDQPTARMKLIEQNVTKPRYVDGGWTSIIEGVRAALQDHYGLTFAE